MPELGRREPDAERVVHDAGHAADLALKRLVEAVDRGRAALQDRVAQAADERHRGDPARLDLRVEGGRLLERFLGLGALDLDRLVLALLSHASRV